MSEAAATGGKKSDVFVMSAVKLRRQRIKKVIGEGFLLAIASFVAVIVLFIFYFVAVDAIPFFQEKGFTEFFTSTSWYPADEPGEFGALAIIFGSGMVTIGSALIAIPLGVSAAICLSDVLPFSVRQYAKPVIEMLAAIPSVAYGFFALVILAPMLQNHGGPILMWAWWLIAGPFLLLFVVVLGDLLASAVGGESESDVLRNILTAVLAVVALVFLYWIG
ncbi:MAG: phosphate ABC transporter permease, partial [Chlorobium sp.]|nr:phosphate ABC transporter permease [Chlorobium sp.]